MGTWAPEPSSFLFSEISSITSKAVARQWKSATHPVGAPGDDGNLTNKIQQMEKI
jgi:hypothetical protein